MRSLAIVLAVVAVVLMLSTRDHAAVVTTVDPAVSLAEARSQAGYPVLAPVGLGTRWRPTSVRVRRNGAALEWHIGYVTPRGDYAGLEQSDGPPGVFLDGFASGGKPTGVVRIGDRSWRRLEGGRPEPRALLLREGPVTTLVVGGAAWSELDALAAALRTG
ncbi:MAG: hypothetical protein QOJ90_581 [Actinomycetota bacterium]|nr:hypothetical protein [Actinomycetota bacterium]